MRRLVAPALAGVLFAIGLGLSGMTRPEKVLGFLDVAGRWDPSLAFVMAGAIGAHLLFARRAVARPFTLSGEAIRLPTKVGIDRRHHGDHA